LFFILIGKSFILVQDGRPGTSWERLAFAFGETVKEQEAQIPCDTCDEVRSRNYLSTELRIIGMRWLIIVFLALAVNLLSLPGWDIWSFDALLAFACVYNLLFLLALRRRRSFSKQMYLLSRYLDILSIAIGLYLSGGVNSPMLFLWYLSLFAAGVRFGYRGSFWLQVPVGLLLVFLLYYEPTHSNREALNRLVLGLFSFTAAAFLGSIFGREEKYSMEIMTDLRKDSITDRLTGLFNYSYFMDELQREQARAERTNSHFSLAIFDLDRFKQVNDTYGHEKGNLLLQDVATILKANARKMDTVARYGGEEFVILMPESNGSEMVVAERIRKKIEEAEFPGIAERPIKITISGGVCTYPRDAASVNELLDKTDKGLYAAKTCGRNRTSYCEPVGQK
jgi:diguanylate cyclase (GGDEF)-like protein